MFFFKYRYQGGVRVVVINIFRDLVSGIQDPASAMLNMRLFMSHKNYTLNGTK
jgi:hypothetical protein